MKKVIAAVALLGMAFGVNAADSGWNNYRVDRATIVDNEFAEIKLNKAFNTNCPLGNDLFFRIALFDLVQEGNKIVPVYSRKGNLTYQLALMSYALDSEIKVTTDGCADGLPLVNRIIVR